MKGAICDFSAGLFCKIKAKCPKDGEVELEIVDHYCDTSAKCLGKCGRYFQNDGEGWPMLWVAKAFRDEKNKKTLSDFNKRIFDTYKEDK